MLSKPGRLLFKGLLLAAMACGEDSQVTQPTRSIQPREPNRDSQANNHICVLSPSPSGITVYVGQTATVSGGAYLCDNGDNHSDGPTTAWFFAGNESIATVTTIHD
jgi:hypothetical protein